ncbi:predicted protein [Streptomyces viridosporus ATCC 14672]|uniref:Predicted protein n=1 Tax=Streptomyces viridosporus (strain ATCC 14672 / DSM 40746 / JCM 4963 / KCTC 9882 / NRRL B-12104 / FH 1290) TaxID=566461 RepID=D5ZSR4_STRV1|nr:predicted protein [Streptomyces viridosporus ATCC 14672]
MLRSQGVVVGAGAPSPGPRQHCDLQFQIENRSLPDRLVGDDHAVGKQQFLGFPERRAGSGGTATPRARWSPPGTGSLCATVSRPP